METKKSPLSIRLIYWLTTASMIFLMLAFLIAVAMNMWVNWGTIEGKSLSLNVPANFDVLETGSIQFQNSTSEVQLVKATAEISIKNPPRAIARQVGIFILLALIVVFYLMGSFWLLIRNVKAGEIFIEKNIKLLKQLAYGLVGVWVFMLGFSQLIKHYLIRKITMESIEFVDTSDTFNELLVVALFIWILAHIFGYGLELQKEKELTI